MGKLAQEGTRGNVYFLDPENLVLVEDEAHPLYDARVKLPVEDGLVRNIMVYGVLEPVLISKEGDKSLVVAGRQRVKAALEANKRLHKEGKEKIKVPCMFRRGESHDLFGVLISENENRRDDDVLAKALKLQKFLNMGRSEEEAAIAFGVTLTSVKDWLSVLELSSPVKKAIQDGKIAASAARQLVKLEPDKQKEALEKLLESGKATGTRAKKAAGKNGTARKSGLSKKEEGTRDRLALILREAKLPDTFRELLGWALGEVSGEEAGKTWPFVLEEED